MLAKMFKKWFKGGDFKKVITANAALIVIPGRALPFTMSRDHRLYPSLEKAINDRDMEGVLDIVALVERVIIHTEGKVSIKNGVVYFQDQPVHNIVAKRILQFMAEGIPCSFLIKFLERVMQNPLESAQKELFLFLENGDLPIMDDGRFIAYKWVDGNLKDCHTGTFDNTPGTIVSMPREQCDTNRNETCSQGLHVCTQYYSKFGTRLLLVAVAAEDVVAVPYDYNNAKMRTWQYEVLEEIDAGSYGTLKERAFVQYKKHVPAQEQSILDAGIPVSVGQVKVNNQVISSGIVNQPVDNPRDVIVKPKLSNKKKVKGTGMTEVEWDKFKKAVKNKKSVADFGLSDEDVKHLRKKAKEENANGQSS